MAADYDSRPETHDHIAQVRGLMIGAAADIVHRGHVHDRSKLSPPELPVFDRVTPRLAATTYGSDEYEGYRKSMGRALDHHYRHNDHHPEHFIAESDREFDGIAAMNLIQILEMLCDWIAASRRHEDGDIYKSIEVNADRFGYGEEMRRLLRNSVTALLILEQDAR